jgi:hypothetical protein
MTSGAVSIKPVWITDPHIDHLNRGDPGALERLGAILDRLGATHILLGGDVADCRSFEEYLSRLTAACGRPVYFVLGNHDYYFGTVASVRERAACLGIPGASWLARSGVVDLGGGTALVGRGGWGDAHCGDLEDFTVLTDYAAIGDLSATIDLRDFWLNGFHKREALVARLRELGEEAAEDLTRDVLEAAGAYRRILILTHVTPFRETCTYRDRPGDVKGFPGFLWDSMGLRLRSIAEEYPGAEFLVFSGHTHAESRCRIAPNLRAWSSLSEYGTLRVREICPEEDWEPGESVVV